MARRIVALLVAFAGLAENAAERSQPVRFLILILLRRAETIARDYLADALLLDGLWFDDGMEGTSRPQDAILLARRFRLLAEEYVALLEPAGRRGGWIARRDAAPRGPVPCARSRAAAPVAAARSIHDTS